MEHSLLADNLIVLCFCIEYSSWPFHPGAQLDSEGPTAQLVFERVKHLTRRFHGCLRIFEPQLCETIEHPFSALDTNIENHNSSFPYHPTVRAHMPATTLVIGIEPA